MKAETGRFVERARGCVARAKLMMTVGLHEDAARTAYFASFHVDQAYIFERTSKISKSHNGVQTEFFRLTKDDRRADTTLRRFLSQAYEFKSVADCSTGDDASISAVGAAEAVLIASRFVDHFTILVPFPRVTSEE